jgi:hypothetical protein
MKPITDILDGKADSSANPCIQLFGLLFKSIEDAHVTHLIQDDKSYAKHMALNTYYDAMPGMVDTLVETYKALYPVTDIKVPQSSKIDDAEGYFNDLYKRIEDSRSSVKESFLLSQLDIIQQEVAHCLYRLKFVK